MEHSEKSRKVSVIMLAYNHAPYVSEAIESVLSQNRDFSMEVLIGDDASTDGTARIVGEYANRYPDLIVPVLREQNIGATENLYDLIQRAEGAYLAYLECDDYWSDPQKLCRQVEFLENHPAYIGCTHRVTLVDPNGRPLEEKLSWVRDKSVYTLEDFDGITLAGHGNSLVHRNFFPVSKGKYRTLLTLHSLIGDRPLCLLLVSMGPIYQMQEEFGCYRRPVADGGSATSVLFINNPEKNLDDYRFTKKLETYARDKLQIYANFEPYKNELLLGAVWTFLRHPDRYSATAAWEMLHDRHRPEHIRFLVTQIIKKIISKLRCRP